MGKFEERWTEVFEGAEISPSGSVWINIDRDLANGEGAAMKKRMLLYQRIAAAAVMFALLIGSLGIYRWKDISAQVAQNKAFENKLPSPETVNNAIDKEHHEANTSEKLKDRSEVPGLNNAIASSKSNDHLVLNKFKIKSEDRNSAKTGIAIDEKSAVLSAGQPIGSPGEKASHAKIIAYHEERTFLGDLGALESLGLLPVPEIHEGPLQAEILHKLPAISGAFLARKEKKTMHEQVWASVTAAAGSYNPNTNSYSSYNYAASQSASASNSSSVGSSYSFGMLAGMRITKRVVVQSGVQYANQSIGSVSNINSSTSLDAVAQFAGSSPALNYNTITPYNITSANEFVSVPVQAGYLFIDRRIGLQLNSGVSTDFFIRNTLSDPSGQRQSYSQAAGQDSPYRSVNFSGLVSSEVSYKLSDHYRVAVVPGFHYSFNPVLKSSSGPSGNPFVWDVGFRFRYIFK